MQATFNSQSDLEADGAAVGEVASGGVELADGAHLWVLEWVMYWNGIVNLR